MWEFRGGDYSYRFYLDISCETETAVDISIFTKDNLT